MRSDHELLAGDPLSFGEFYARHERAVFRYYYRRVADAEVAADLSAECFAAAMLSRCPADVLPVAWLFGIAKNVLRRSAERRRVESKARSRLGMPPLVLEDETLAALNRIHAGQLMDGALAYLPADQAEAVRARIVDEREYDEIARSLRTSEAVVRKRVSRGLGALRRRFGDSA
jgi:RNA polymerase sigma factor (sigma-70 family)